MKQLIAYAVSLWCQNYHVLGKQHRCLSLKSSLVVLNHSDFAKFPENSANIFFLYSRAANSWLESLLTIIIMILYTIDCAILLAYMKQNSSFPFSILQLKYLLCMLYLCSVNLSSFLFHGTVPSLRFLMSIWAWQKFLFGKAQMAFGSRHSFFCLWYNGFSQYVRFSKLNFSCHVWSHWGLYYIHGLTSLPFVLILIIQSAGTLFVFSIHINTNIAKWHVGYIFYLVWTILGWCTSNLKDGKSRSVTCSNVYNDNINCLFFVDSSILLFWFNPRWVM